MNHWCSECGAEITAGTICNRCDPENGSEHVTYTFVGFLPSEQEAGQREQSEEQRPWWKLW
ncbi:hypothetical protein [Ktedonospora formicarum]|uniref:Uncharacterized protein n=1 Tax=Ktedonospora formicarum TaxID=2778364 RepID=A0A8J3MWJ7_9CHLR|nr:hypothetical protein [Ktedonospora formicarum]GHO51507.1 hypothetical protein KSX_96700 [Ktedonospora formicarum]